MDLTALNSLKTDMEKCFRCSLCKMVPLPTVKNPEFTDACPASRLYHFHGYSGSGKQIMALSLLDGRIEADSAMAQIVFACTTCGYCDVACKFIMDAERHQVNMALREHLVHAGLFSDAHKKVVDTLKVHKNCGAWADGLGLPVLPEQKADILLFAGCGHGDDQVARKLARLLVHAGLDVGYLGDAEPCCGLPAYWCGFSKDFSKVAASTSALINSLGVKTVVAASGSCLGAFRSKYPEYASAPEAEVVHATELLARLIDEGSLSLPKALKAKLTYHDPCYLGRQSEPPAEWEGEEKIALGVMTYTDPPKPINFGTEGVYEPPRKILEKIPGVEFVEMYRIREYSFCCGAGGGVVEAYPELARSAAMHRLEEARDVGAEKLVTACAHCRAHLINAQEDTEHKADEKLPVVDIVDLVYQAAGLED